MAARAILLAVFSAVLQVASFPTSGPVAAWRAGISWIALVPLILALLGKKDGSRGVRWGALIGYVCGVAFYLGNCSWIYQTMYLYGGMAKPVAAAILVLFSLYLGLYHALFGALMIVVGRSRLGVRGTLVLAPFLWVAVELARGRITGFPWDLLGNALVDNLFVTKIAPVAGVMGIGFLVAAVNAAIAGCWVVEGTMGWVVGAAGLAAAVGLEVAGAAVPREQRAPVGSQQLAVMVQENIAVGATAKGTRPLSVGEELQVFGDLSLHLLAAGKDHYGLGRPAVILWPEAPSELRSDDPEVRAALSKLAKTADAPVIAGSLGVDLDGSADRGYFLYDSASLVDRQGSYTGRYDKIHLVPWGEYVPYKEFFGFAKKLTAGAGDMDPGHTRSVFKADGHAYGVFICYESIFGDEVREFVKNGAEVLVNLSDDGWYGDTGAPWQHLNMARMRAIENHRWVLRDTNTGETTTIDPLGRYVETQRHVRTVYALPFAFETGMTFYTRHGDWFAWVCAVVTAATVGYGLRDKSKTQMN